MKISQLAKTYGVNPDTIRHYVRIGLLVPSYDPTNGYKHFGSTQQKRLAFILKAKSLGFTLSDIEIILKQTEQGESPCPRVREIMAERLVQTELKLQAMQKTYRQMQTAMHKWQHQGDCYPTGQHLCHLIEGIAEEF
jgi:DNA-binding transcriptional MerR regulator